MPSWHLAGQQCWASPGMGGQSLVLGTPGERHPSPAHPKPPVTPVCPPRHTAVPDAERGWCGGRGRAGTWPSLTPPGARRLGRPSRVRFSDPEGNVLFEHPVQKSAAPEDGMVRGAGRAGGTAPLLTPAGWAVPPSHRPALPSITHSSAECGGRCPKPMSSCCAGNNSVCPSSPGHSPPERSMGASSSTGHSLQVNPAPMCTPSGCPPKCPSCPCPCTETFGAILTSLDPLHWGAGGMAMLTLSDTENKLHFILMARGLLEPGARGESWQGRVERHSPEGAA